MAQVQNLLPSKNILNDFKSLTNNYAILQNQYKILLRKNSLLQNYQEQNTIFRGKIQRIINLDPKFHSESDKFSQIQKLVDLPVDSSLINFENEAENSMSIKHQAKNYCEKCLKYIPNFLMLIKIIEPVLLTMLQADTKFCQMVPAAGDGIQTGTEASRKTKINPILTEFSRLSDQIFHLEGKNFKQNFYINLKKAKQSSKIYDENLKNLQTLTSTLNLYLQHLMKIFKTDSYHCYLKQKCSNYETLLNLNLEAQTVKEFFKNYLRNPSDKMFKLKFFESLNELIKMVDRDCPKLDDSLVSEGQLVVNCFYEDYKSMIESIKNL